ncbi:MAG TPA: YqiA/YcfP family alpha/beta fold hydrolase [Pseudomonadales bacterium]|jgi:hypothetical protein
MPPTVSLLYAHGFISSPDSAKVRALREYLACHHPHVALQVPALSPKPALAMACLEQALAGMPHPVGLIGSSMGGFYCAQLAERYDLRAWLINPLARVQPYAADYLGDHVHAYTGEHFTIDGNDVAYLQRMEIRSFSAPRHIMLSVQTGDETLDYRHAVSAWPGVVTTVIAGGNHHFTHFDQWLPLGLRFLGLRSMPL